MCQEPILKPIFDSLRNRKPVFSDSKRFQKSNVFESFYILYSRFTLKSYTYLSRTESAQNIHSHLSRTYDLCVNLLYTTRSTGTVHVL